MKKVNIYENNGGMLSAIISEGEKILNIISGLEDGQLSGLEFIQAAQGGFEYADEYEPESYAGLSLEDAAAEIEEGDELVATISRDSIQTWPEAMGEAASELFTI